MEEFRERGMISDFFSKTLTNCKKISMMFFVIFFFELLSIQKIGFV